MSAWIGPAIVAAVISSSVTIAGWFVAHERDRRTEAARRQEKIRDVQTALLAEISSNISRFARIDLVEAAADKRDRILSDPGYTHFVPRDASTVVFDALPKEIHILPSQTIEPVVSYYKQAFAVAHFVDDLKSDAYEKLDPKRKAEMYVDYLRMIIAAVEKAEEARRVLGRSLQIDGRG